MSRARGESTRWQVSLSEGEKESLIQEAYQVIDETLATFDDFVAKGREFPKAEWKPLRRKDQVRVYKERNVHKESRDESFEAPTIVGMPLLDPEVNAHGSRASVSSLDGVSNATMVHRPLHLPLIVVHGTLSGKVEDFLLGVTQEELKEGDTKYRGDSMNSAVESMQELCRLESPSKDNPFRYLRAKWFVLSSGPFKVVTSARDYVVVEGMGMMTDANGERVGYHICHSVRIPQFSDATSGYVRGFMSFCYLMRQLKPNLYEIYGPGFSDSCGKIPEHLGTALIARMLIAQVELHEVGYVKKLQWLMADAARKGKRHRYTTSSEGSSVSAYSKKDDKSVCGICTKRVHRLSTWNAAARPDGTTCRICGETVCAKCSAIKKVNVPVGRGLVKKAWTFCLECSLVAQTLSGFEVASSDVVKRKSTIASTSEISSCESDDVYASRDWTLLSSSSISSGR